MSNVFFILEYQVYNYCKAHQCFDAIRSYKLVFPVAAFVTHKYAVHACAHLTCTWTI